MWCDAVDHRPRRRRLGPPAHSERSRSIRHLTFVFRNAHPDPHVDADAHTEPDRNTDTLSYPDADPDNHGYTHTDARAWFECLCVWQQHENAEPHSVGELFADPDFVRNAESYSHPDPNSDTEPPHWRLSVCDADGYAWPDGLAESHAQPDVSHGCSSRWRCSFRTASCRRCRRRHGHWRGDRRCFGRSCGDRYRHPPEGRLGAAEWADSFLLEPWSEEEEGACSRLRHWLESGAAADAESRLLPAVSEGGSA
jgi:hypothetical protein